MNRHFFQKAPYRWTTGTWKMLNITGLQGNGDPNHSESSLCTCHYGSHLKKKKGKKGKLGCLLKWQNLRPTSINFSCETETSTGFNKHPAVLWFRWAVATAMRNTRLKSCQAQSSVNGHRSFWYRVNLGNGCFLFVRLCHGFLVSCPPSLPPSVLKPYPLCEVRGCNEVLSSGSSVPLYLKSSPFPPTV